MKESSTFWSRVLGFEGGCWEWIGPVDTRGYGHMKWRGKRTIAPEYGISAAQVQRVRLGQQWK